MKTNITMKTLIVSTLLALPAMAAAQSGEYDYVWARVVGVDPIVAHSSSPESRQVCWEQPVTYYQPGRSYPTYRRDPTTGTLVGALIGGVVGNQVGSGSGRTAATVAGALAGGAIGRNVGDTRADMDAGEPRVRDGYEQVCEMRTTEQTERRVIGYDVSYELDGQVFNARTDAHPGDQIRVAIVPYED